MSPVLKNGILIGIVAVILIAAGFSYKKRSADSGLPDDPNLATHWMCEESGEHFDLTPAKFDNWVKNPDQVRYDKSHPGLIVFKNPKTGRFTIVPADVDPFTKDWYIKQNSKGEKVPLPEKIQQARDAAKKK